MTNERPQTGEQQRWTLAGYPEENVASIFIEGTVTAVALALPKPWAERIVALHNASLAPAACSRKEATMTRLQREAYDDSMEEHGDTGPQTGEQQQWDDTLDALRAAEAILRPPCGEHGAAEALIYVRQAIALYAPASLAPAAQDGGKWVWNTVFRRYEKRMPDGDIARLDEYQASEVINALTAENAALRARAEQAEARVRDLEAYKALADRYANEYARTVSEGHARIDALVSGYRCPCQPCAWMRRYDALAQPASEEA